MVPFLQLLQYSEYTSHRRCLNCLEGAGGHQHRDLTLRQFLDRFEAHPSSDDSSLDRDDSDDDVGNLSNPADDLSLQLARYSNNSKFSDVILKVGAHSFHAHKLVLCYWSEAFWEMFIRPRRKTGSDEGAGGGSQFEECTLAESEECSKVFGDFLKFMYTETVELNDNNVYPVFELAKKYKVQGLCDVCQEFLIEQVSNDGEEALDTMSKAEEHGMTKLYHHCFSVLETNFEFLPQSCLLNMSPSLFLKLIESSKLVVLSESKVWAQASYWLMHEEKEEHKKYTEQVMSRIRFPHIPPFQLKKLSSILFQSARMYPELKQVLQKVLPGIYEWKVLAPDDVFDKLPYHARFVAYSRNYVHLRYYFGDQDEDYAYNILQLRAVSSRDGGDGNIPVGVVGVSSNNVCEALEKDKDCWSLSGATVYDQTSEKWGIVAII